MGLRASIKRQVLARQEGQCAGLLDDGERCGVDLAALKRNRPLQKYLPAGRSAVEFDHVIPQADGGSDEPENVQALCGWCHARKTEAERPGWREATPSALAGVIIGPGEAVTAGRRRARERKGRNIGTRGTRRAER